MSTGGKGSRRRKSLVDYKQFSDNWNTIFGKKEKQTESTTKPCYQEGRCKCDNPTCANRCCLE